MRLHNGRSCLQGYHCDDALEGAVCIVKRVSHPSRVSGYQRGQHRLLDPWQQDLEPVERVREPVYGWGYGLHFDRPQEIHMAIR